MYKLFLFFFFKALQSVSGHFIGMDYKDVDVAERVGWNGLKQHASTFALDIPGVITAPSSVTVPFSTSFVEDIYRTPFYKPSSLAASRGTGLMVTSFSPITQTGISLKSECACKGMLPVFGSMPFLGAVVLEGAVPNTGVGAVGHRCGSDEVTVISEGISAYGASTGPLAYKFAAPMFFDHLAYDDGYAGQIYAGGTAESLDSLCYNDVINRGNVYPLSCRVGDRPMYNVC